MESIYSHWPEGMQKMNQVLLLLIPQAPTQIQIIILNAELQKVRKSDNKKCEDSEPEDAILNDRMTSTSEIKETPSVSSLVSLNEVRQSSCIFKDLRVQEEQSQSMRQKLLDECAQLKEKLHEKEEEIVSITKKLQAFGDQKLFKELGGR